jgi:hypothetical protein
MSTFIKYGTTYKKNSLNVIANDIGLNYLILNVEIKTPIEVFINIFEV